MHRVTAFDGLEVRARLQGPRTPIVFVHGAMDRSSAFLRAARILMDHPIIIYDRRGYGRSLLQQGMAAPGISDHVNDLHGILEYCTIATGRVPRLVGHSLGGTIGLLAASERPASIAGLVLYESPLLWESWWPRREDPIQDSEESFRDDPYEGARTAERFMRRMVGDEQWESLPDQIRARRLEEGRTLRSELMSCRAVDAPKLDGITVPVILGLGSGADEVRRRAASTLAASLTAAATVEVVDAPHNLHTSDPARFSALVGLLDSTLGPGTVTIP